MGQEEKKIMYLVVSIFNDKENSLDTFFPDPFMIEGTVDCLV